MTSLSARRADALLAMTLSERPTEPKDPMELAASAGAAAIRCTDGPQSFTDLSRPSPTIYLARGLSPIARRFVAAHELGHCLLATPAGRGLAEAWALGYRDEERLCNRVAAALLLPEPWVRERVGPRPRLDDLTAVAAEAKVALTTVAARLGELSRPVTLLRFRRSRDGTWRLDARYGAGHQIQGQAELDGPSALRADAPGAGPGTMDCSWTAGPHRWTCRADVRRGGDHLLVYPVGCLTRRAVPECDAAPGWRSRMWQREIEALGRPPGLNSGDDGADNASVG